MENTILVHEFEADLKPGLEAWLTEQLRLALIDTTDLFAVSPSASEARDLFVKGGKLHITAQLTREIFEIKGISVFSVVEKGE